MKFEPKFILFQSKNVFGNVVCKISDILSKGRRGKAKLKVQIMGALGSASVERHPEAQASDWRLVDRDLRVLVAEVK